jgi:hypothetical protein
MEQRFHRAPPEGLQRGCQSGARRAVRQDHIVGSFRIQFGGNIVERAGMAADAA